MPITPAHAAAAWPVHRAWRRLPLAALVIGTLSPDLEYVLRLTPRGKFAHSPVGLVVFCVPATLLLWWAWRALVRPALMPLLPPGLRRAAELPPPGRRTDALPLAIFAALLGAATHVLWDGFTHQDGWAVALWPMLAQRAFGPTSQTWFSLFQYASSAVGVVIVAVWAAVQVRRYPADAREFEPGQKARLLRVAAFVVGTGVVVGVANALIGRTLAVSLGRGAVGAMLGIGVALAAYALHVRRGAGDRGIPIS